MLCLNGLLDGREKQRTIDCDRSLGNGKIDEKEREGWARHHRLDTTTEYF